MSPRSFPLLAAAVAAAALLVPAGCGSTAGSIPPATTATAATHLPPPGTLFSWLQPGIDSTHAAYNTTEKKLKAGNVSRLKQGWSFATGAEIGNPIVTDGATIFIDSGSGYLYAVNAKTGVQKWRFQTYWGNAWASSPAISGKLIYAPCLVGGSAQRNGLCAVDTGTGKLKWSYYDSCPSCQPPSAVEEGPVVSGSTVVIGYYDVNVYRRYTFVALDATSGTVLWQNLAGPGGTEGYGLANSTPAIDNGNLFAGTNHGVCSYQLATGAQNWCSGPSDSSSSPAAVNGVVYVNTLSSGFYALKESDGSQLWQYAPCNGCGGGYDDPPAIANGTAYFSGNNQGYLYALNATTGALIFDTSNDGGNSYTDSSPSVANGVVYVACQAGVCEFNASNGTLLATQGNGQATPAAPAIANGRVFSVCGYNNACMYDL